MKVYDFRAEGMKDARGVDRFHPLFSWKMESERRGTQQQKYSLTVKSGERIVWSRKNVKSGETINIRYAGEHLQPRTEYSVFLSVTDNNGETSEAELIFETGKLDEPFSAEFIAPKSKDWPVFRLEKKLNIKRGVVKARLYASALGLYEFYIGGVKAGDIFFAPFWTDYRHTLEYQTYDVTDLLHTGENELEMMVGKGWYAGALGFAGEKAHYGSRTAGMAELHLWYEDGTEEVLCTDETWKAASCFIEDSEFYYGERQNFLLEREKDEVCCIGTGRIKLVGQRNEPVRCVEQVQPVSAFYTPKGEYVLDFGQNLVGFVRLETDGERGQELKVRHAEILDEKGNFYTENLRTAKSEDVYILAEGRQILQPHFTFHGFRYVQIIGKEIAKENVVAMVVHSDIRATGKFECSDKRINQLQSNIVWGQRGNFVDVPTDCPQRDERLGWTGDANVFFRTAAFNYDVSRFFEKWLQDLMTEQYEDGNVPHVIPNTLGRQDGAALWCDCATMIPWNKYLVYGNVRDLEEQFLSMKRWADYVYARCGENGLWQSGFQYGDWLALDAGNAETRTGATDKYFVANVFYYVTTEIVALAAKELNDMENFDAYWDRKNRILNAIRREYITSTGRLVSETQTACALALYFDIVPRKHKKRVAAALKNNLAENKNHLNTGFAGTPYLLFALSENGLHDIAAQLLFNDDYPSWLYEIKHGATTIWERWNGILPDGKPYDPAMNSFNHYSYGAVGDFLYRKVAGIDCLKPGYKKISIRPTLTKGLESVRAELETVYGKVVSAYECRNGKIRIEVEVPCNTEAEIVLPEREKTVRVGSGRYEFEYETQTDLSIKRFSMENTFGSFLEYAEAKDFLEKVSPGILSGPMIAFAANMTLNELCAYSGEDGAKLFGALIAHMNGLDAQGILK